MSTDQGDQKAKEAIAASFLELERSLNADPKFMEMAEATLEGVLDVAERFKTPPVLVVQCLFNRAAKATRDIKPAA